MPFVNKFKILVCTVCLMLVGQGFASNFWADHVSKPGTETINDTVYYSITSAEELAWVALQTQTDHPSNAKQVSINFILKNDIDLAGKIWTPICPGGGNVHCNGIFDGDGHSIKNMTIVSDSIYARYHALYPSWTGKNDMGTKYVQNAGLVGTLGSGTIKNLSMTDVSFYITNGSSTENQISVGPLVGWKDANKGTIDFCSASGNIYTSGARQGVGGLVGNAHSSTIKNSISYTNIYASGDSAYVGGIVGLTKNNEVKIESCVYAGGDLVSSGNKASVGAVAGYVVSGSGPNPTNTYFYNGGTSIPAVGNKEVSGVTGTNKLNTEKVACILNGGEWNENSSECSIATGSWSVGLSGLSLNGSDGFKVTFNANGGTFASGAKTSKILAAGETVTADEIATPTREGKKFGGWATSADMTEPSENLGVSEASKVVYAVWYDFYPVTFNWNTESHTNQVAKHGVVAVEGFDVPKAYESDSGKYYFTGWAYEAKWFKDENYFVQKTDTVCLDSVDVTGAVNLFAIWTKAKTFSVTFNATLHGKNNVQIVRIVSEGDTVAVPDTIITDPGYKLVGWFTDEACTKGNEYNFSLALDGDLVLYAKWEIEEYHITYELNGGKNVDANIDTYTINSDDIVLANPTNKGASFDGWFYDAQFTNRATQISKGSWGDKKFYAKWTPYTYTIHYLSGSRVAGTTASDEKQYDVPKQLKDAVDVFAIKGCTQDGWSRTDMGEKAFNVGQSYEGNEDLMLYPHWTCNTYDITYEMFGVDAVNYFKPGTEEVHNPTQYTGPAALTLKNAYAPDKQSFFMDNWYKENTFKTTIRTIKDMDAPITVYARWYNKITYKPGSNVSGAKDSVYKKYFGKSYNLLASIKNYARTNYTLDGWSLTDGGEKVYALGVKYSTNENLTLYPHWVADEHNITYNNVDPSELPEGYPTTYTHENAVTLPIPTRTGYEFLGWYVDGEFNGNAVTEIPENQTEDKEFFAKWSDAVEYSITYDLDDGTNDIDNPASYTVETETITLKDAVKNGYTFDGWFNESDVQVTTVAGGATGNIELTAKWTPVEYTITYENVNGATNDNATAYTIEQTVAINALEKDGFAFRGWFTNAQFTGEPVIDISAGASGDTTFYAKWLEIFTITYAAGNDEGVTGEVAAGTKTETENATLSSEGFARTGYTQTGWKTEDGSATYDMGGTYTADASVTLYPIWNVETYNVVYHNVDGATFVPNPETYTVEDVFPIALNSPAKVGFTFLGWSLVDNSTEYVDVIAAGSTGDANFYANWELAPSPITVTASSGTFEFDKQTHNATCSYEGTLPTGYSIEMVPSGSVKNVADGEVTTTCAVTIKDESDNDVTDMFTELTVVNGTISVVTKTVPYGAVTIYTDESGSRAEIEGEYTGKGVIEINDKVEVKEIIFNREFATGSKVYSTIMFPFSIEKDKISGGTFYGFSDVDENYNVHLTSKIGDVLEANTPYIVEATEDRLTFDLKGDAVEFSTTVKNAKKSSNGKWDFIGTYEFRTWKADDDDIGRVYGFASKTTSDPNSIGQFRMGRVGTTIKPMRAYLLYTPVPASAPAPLAKSSVVKVSALQGDAPDELNVVIDGDDGETTFVGTLNAATGEIKIIDNWFDMKGRKLNAKPTTKGIYYYNGKRVIVR